MFKLEKRLAIRYTYLLKYTFFRLFGIAEILQESSPETAVSQVKLVYLKKVVL